MGFENHFTDQSFFPLGEKIFETGKSLHRIAQPVVVEEEVILYNFKGEDPFPLDQCVNGLERFLDKLMEGYIFRIINLRDPHQYMKFGDKVIPQFR